MYRDSYNYTIQSNFQFVHEIEMRFKLLQIYTCILKGEIMLSKCKKCREYWEEPKGWKMILVLLEITILRYNLGFSVSTFRVLINFLKTSQNDRLCKKG